MEFPVAFIERPRLYGDRVTFLVYWEDRSVTEEEIKHVCYCPLFEIGTNLAIPGHITFN